MKMILAAALLSVSSFAMASTYSCDEQMTVTIKGAGLQAKIDIDGLLLSASNLSIVAGSSMPGTVMATGEMTSKMPGASKFEGALIVDQVLLQGAAKGTIKRFAGESFVTLNCTKVK